jgi:hypothetical protein
MGHVVDALKEQDQVVATVTIRARCVDDVKTDAVRDACVGSVSASPGDRLLICVVPIDAKMGVRLGELDRSPAEADAGSGTASSLAAAKSNRRCPETTPARNSSKASESPSAQCASSKITSTALAWVRASIASAMAAKSSGWGGEPALVK